MVALMNEKQERIKELFQKLNHKSEFMNELAQDLERSPRTLRKWWFSNYGLWSVPDAHQDYTIEKLEEKVNSQE